jgi:hypothetical protein
MTTLVTPEWSIPDPSVPVRQGDLLICRDPQKGIIEGICLLITADCDISQGKFGRQLLCLRVIPFEEYLRTIWPARKLKGLVENETEKVRVQLAKWHTKQIGVESKLTSAAITSWAKRSDATSICVELGIPDPDRKKIEAALSTFQAAVNTLKVNEQKDSLTQLIAFRAALQGKESKTIHQEYVNQAQAEKLPADVFLLPNLPQANVGPAVVLLREIVGVKQDNICYRVSDAVTNDMLLRVGRLEPTFKYAVSQAFGFLYSRIGLPSDYEFRCKCVIEQISELVKE